MLSILISEKHEHETEECFARDQRYTRNQKEDLKRGIDVLYAFKQTLNELHPSILPIIEAMIRSGID